MTFNPLDVPMAMASRSAFRAEAGAAMEGDVAKVCFIVATVLVGAFLVIGLTDMMERFKRLTDEDCCRER